MRPGYSPVLVHQVCGDRNLRVTLAPSACGLANVPAAVAIDLLDQNVGWTNGVHGSLGNIVLMDGSTATTSSPDLRIAFASSEDDNGTRVHLLKAR